jgi:hypothetical protein
MVMLMCSQAAIYPGMLLLSSPFLSNRSCNAMIEITQRFHQQDIYPC